MKKGSFLSLTVNIILLITLAVAHPMFYIYEWPGFLSDVYPPKGAALHPNSRYDHSFNENNGAGKMLRPDVGLFQTWQFSLFKNIMSRLLVSKYRTRDPSKATSFIVPYDGGVHSYIDHQNGKPRLASPHGWHAQYLLQQAAKNEVFWKNNGHDHFVFFSITINQMVGIGTKTFFMNICQNCTTLTIETSPTNTAISGRSNKYWYAVPYPSSFHWHEGISRYPWTVTETISKNRDIFSLFIGSVKTANTANNALRRTLYDQCSQDPHCQWHTTAHACNGVVNATEQMMLFQRAQFCPAPAGDSITRKSLFDSLLSGCIPVIFAKGSLAQYMWYFTPEERAAVSVFIPKQSIIEEGANYLSILKGISEEEIYKKQKAIEAIAPRLQYSVVPSRIGNGSDGRTWESPIRDAADIIIERILDRQTVEPVHGFSEQELIQQKCMQNDIMANHPDYAGLMPGKAKGGAGSGVSSRLWSKNKCENYSRDGVLQGSTFKIGWEL